MNTGVESYHSQFDVIHCRCVSQGILDFKSFLIDAAACLRPGGVLLIVGPERMGTFNERKEPMTGMKEEFSCFNRILETFVILSSVSLAFFPAGPIMTKVDQERLIC